MLSGGVYKKSPVISNQMGNSPLVCGGPSGDDTGEQNRRPTPDTPWGRRSDVLYGLASLSEGCGRYFGAHLRPIIRRLSWMILFPDACPATSHKEWLVIARRILRLAEDRRRPCSDHETRTLRAVWERVIEVCPHSDIRRVLVRRAAHHQHHHRTR